MTSNSGATQPTWPVKTHEVRNHHLDTRIWNNFQFRDNDIVIATWAKSGTTWVQQIVSQLIFSGADEVCPLDRSPWLDMRIAANEETLALLDAQTHRRFIKTHAPIDFDSPQSKGKVHLHRSGWKGCDVEHAQPLLPRNVTVLWYAQRYSWPRW